MTRYRHRLLATSTYTGSDTIKFYDAGGTDVYVIHVQEREELYGYADAEYGKYNAVVHHVDVLGFDNFEPYAGSYEHTHGLFPSMGVGRSVHESLKSSDFVMTGHEPGCFDLGLRAIEAPYLGDVVAEFGDRNAVRLVIAEAMYGCGAGDRVSDTSGNNRRVLERDARREF
jgi:hypothetical protein